MPIDLQWIDEQLAHHERCERIRLSIRGEPTDDQLEEHREALKKYTAAAEDGFVVALNELRRRMVDGGRNLIRLRDITESIEKEFREGDNCHKVSRILEDAGFRLRCLLEED